MEPFRPPQALLDALADFEAVEWAGQVWRHTFGEFPPDKANLRGARWNPAGVEALYTSLSRETALAEAEHQLDIQPLRPTVSRTIHKLNVRVYRLVDLTGPGALARLGASPDDLLGDDLRVCQEIGGSAAYLEVDGLLVPSARHDGSNLVVLFVDTEPSPLVEITESVHIG